MYETKIHTTITDIKKETWDLLTENNIFMSYDWLKTFEKTTTLKLKPQYLTVFENGELIAISVWYLDERTEGESIDNLLFGRLRQMKFFNKFSFMPALICYPKKGFGTHLVVSRSVNPNDLSKIFDEFLNVIERTASGRNFSIGFWFVMQKEKDLIDILLRRGFLKTISYPLSYMDVTWNTFNEYKNYVAQIHPTMKKTIQREINKNRKEGVLIERISGQQLNVCQPRLIELLHLNHIKYGVQDIDVKKNYFQTLIENFGDNALIFVASKNENIIGVCVLLKKGTEGYIANIGVDHQYSTNDFTYFNIMYYEPVNYAISNNIKKLYYSNALYDVKSRRGCTIAETYFLYKPRKNFSLSFFIIRLWFIIHKKWMKRKYMFTKNLRTEKD